MFGDILFLLAITCALVGALGAAISNKISALSIRISFISSIIAACLGIASAFTILFDQPISFELFSTPTFFGSFGFSIDKLSAFFILTICILTVPVSIYSLDYMKEYVGKYSPGLMGVLYNLFFTSMLMVVAADNAIFFLMVWEIMSVVSYLLVIYENKKKEAIFAGSVYIIMTHVGTAFIIIAFLIMGNFAGSYSFASFTSIAGTMPVEIKNIIFIMLLIGFGMKSGMMPLHVWLPYAHPSAPSNISAQMSGVMIKTAIFMMIRTFFDFLGASEFWWGIVVLSIGCLSAVLGVMYAYVERDLKRLLGYHSVENIGIILIGVGMAMIFQSQGFPQLASLALIGALFHVINHSIFKGLLFLGTGAVLYSTHTKDMERLGGLVKKMPQTAAFFLIGSLSIAAMPPFNGFVSEWLIFQSLFLSFNIPVLAIKLVIPFAIGILALTGGLAIGCFVHTFGLTFLALPRSKEAEHAQEVPKTMRVGMGILATLCFVLGVCGSLVVNLLDAVTSPITHISAMGSVLSNGILINAIPASFGDISPLLVAITLAIMILGVYLFSRFYGGQKKVTFSDTWDCGTPLNERNEYTATGYSQSVDRVFSGIYRPEIHVKTVATASSYIFKEKTYNIEEKVDVFEKYVYFPLVKGIISVANKVKKLQNGNLLAYLAYIFIALIIALIIFR